MSYIQGESRNQQMLFPVALGDLIPADHLCRAIEAFVERLDFHKLGFVRATATEAGRLATILGTF
jgi:transposase